MANFVLEIFDDEGARCSFYTVKKLDEDFSETDQFILKFRDDNRLRPFLNELMGQMVMVIGEKYGARDYFFRFENQAQALPPNPGLSEISVSPDFPLRLYCLKVSNSCVVLFNGAEKTSQTSQGGKTRIPFYEANDYANRILKAFQERTIKLSENKKEILDYTETDSLSDIIL